MSEDNSLGNNLERTSLNQMDHNDNNNNINNNNINNNINNINNNNINNISNNNNNNTSSQSEYSFWAEQAFSAHKEYSAGQNTEEIKSKMDAFTIPPNPQAQYSYQNPYNVQVDPVQVTTAPPKNGKRRFGRFLAFTCKAAVFGIIAAVSFIGFNQVYYHYNPDAKPITARPSSKNNAGSPKLNLDSSNSDSALATTTVSEGVQISSADVSTLVENTMPATVSIYSKFDSSYYIWGQEYKQEQEGGGSGIIIGKTDDELLIATNNHVVEDSTSISINFIDGSTATGIIKGRDATADLALLSIDTSTLKKETMDAIKVAKLGDSSSTKVGQMVVAIGNALGYGQSVTVGYISATEREISLPNNGHMTVLQTDAAINPGNSGGALINMKGEVIGINSAKLADTNVEGIGYAIPITNALPIVKDLMTRETLADADKGYLGLYPRDIKEEDAAMYNWPLGVYVYDIVKDGAANKAGILKGDIITAVNDIKITTSDQLREYVNSYRYGTKVTLTLQRMKNGTYKEMKIDVVLQKGDTSSNKKETEPSSDSSSSTEDSNSPNAGNSSGDSSNNGTPGEQSPDNNPNINGETPYEINPAPGEETDPFGDLNEWFNNLLP